MIISFKITTMITSHRETDNEWLLKRIEFYGTVLAQAKDDAARFNRLFPEDSKGLLPLLQRVIDVQQKLLVYQSELKLED